MDRQSRIAPPSGDPPADVAAGRWEFRENEVLFGRYSLIREIGRGGMGLVLRARDAELGIDIALKLIPNLLTHDQEALDELKEEVLKGMTLTHPGIVRTHGLARDETMAAIVMEFVDGGTFHDLKRMQPGGCFDTESLLPWLEQLGPPLDYAHFDIQIAHRDIKPRNLMYSRAGRVKIADFGISSTLEDSMTRVTMKGPSSGTPSYMSPQQVMGGQPSHLDDIYGLGTTLYELLTGKPPFFKGEVIYQVLESIPPPMNERREALGVSGKQPVPEVWERVIAACLSKKPGSRPQSVGEVIHWLKEPAAIRIGTDSPASGETEDSAPRPPARSRLKVAMLASAVVLLATGSAFVIRRTFSDLAPPVVPELRVADIDPLPDGMVDAAYEWAPVAQGGIPPFLWSIESGALPEGIELDPAGRLHGVPSVASEFSFSLKVSDAVSQTVVHEFDLVIHPPVEKMREATEAVAPEKLPPRIASSETLPQGEVGADYEYVLLAESDHPPLLWSLASGDLPAGLVLSDEGVISGIPQDPIAGGFALEVTDHLGAVTVWQATLAILPAAPPEPPAYPPLSEDKDMPFENSLGMRFVPSGTKNVYFSVWLTRVSDFKEFIEETEHNARDRMLSIEKGGKAELLPLGHDWENPGFNRTDDNPVCGVSWNDASAFCSWLTEKEHKAGTLPVGFAYRLPFDSEWKVALGFENPEEPPSFPWGEGSPPALKCNLAGAEIRNGEIPEKWGFIPGFSDNAPYTSPVGFFDPNDLGIHDMYGNVWQWLMDVTDAAEKKRLLRGGSWLTHDASELSLDTSYDRIQSGRGVDAGFRCVLAPFKP